MNEHQRESATSYQRLDTPPAVAPAHHTPPAPPRDATMDHRIGQRWPADLPIAVVPAGQRDAVQSGRLLDLSRNGARVRLDDQWPDAGEAVEIRLKCTAEVTHALIIHVHGSEAGVLWIELPRWLERLVQEMPLRSQSALPK